MNPLVRKPREVKRTGPGGLAIKWSDGSQSNLSSTLLRSNCPCAECREKRGDTSHSAPLNSAGQPTASANKSRSLRIVDNSTEEQLSLNAIWSVGTYAVGIKWGDGHATGIYTFSFLAELAGD